jgi:hypothetical protein
MRRPWPTRGCCAIGNKKILSTLDVKDRALTVPFMHLHVNYLMMAEREAETRRSVKFKKKLLEVVLFRTYK